MWSGSLLLSPQYIVLQKGVQRVCVCVWENHNKEQTEAHLVQGAEVCRKFKSVRRCDQTGWSPPTRMDRTNPPRVSKCDSKTAVGFHYSARWQVFSADLNKHSETIPPSASKVNPGAAISRPAPTPVSASRAGVVWGLCGHGPLERHKYVLRSPLLWGLAVSSQLSQETRE